MHAFSPGHGETEVGVTVSEESRNMDLVVYNVLNAILDLTPGLSPVVGLAHSFNDDISNGLDQVFRVSANMSDLNFRLVEEPHRQSKRLITIKLSLELIDNGSL